jgi:small subunit ribosomal protein S9
MADEITHTIGRRKEAVCRIYLKPGSGKWDINGRTLGDYFPRPALVTAIQQPFTATDKLGQYDVKANLHGGGQTGQAGALRLAVSRALVKIDEGHRRKLRDLGLLTRARSQAVRRRASGSSSASDSRTTVSRTTISQAFRVSTRCRAIGGSRR